MNSRVRAVGRTVFEEARVVADEQGEATAPSQREIVEPHAGRTVADVIRNLSVVGRADGPCLLEEPDTTIYVPSGASVELTEQGHFLIRLDDAAHQRAGTNH